MEFHNSSHIASAVSNCYTVCHFVGNYLTCSHFNTCRLISLDRIHIVTGMSSPASSGRPQIAIICGFFSVILKPRFLDNHLIVFLPLDEAVASRAVFVIVSGSDGNAFGAS